MRKSVLLLMAAVSLLMGSCLKSVDDLNLCTKTIYTGRVVDKNTGLPLANKEVVIGDWDHLWDKDVENMRYVAFRTHTNSSGTFTITADYESVVTADFICDLVILKDDNHYSAVLELLGAGKPVYDYGTIKLEHI